MPPSTGVARIGHAALASGTTVVVRRPRVPRMGPGVCTAKATERRERGSSTHGT